MDEYTSYQHDITELKYLCNMLYNQGMDVLSDSHHGWVNDPTAVGNLQLNELNEHIANFGLTFKIKYPNASELTEILDEYLDETYSLFSNYSINEPELKKWLKAKGRILRYLAGEKTTSALNFNL